MDAGAKIREVLSRAERELAALVAEAVQLGDFEFVQRAAGAIQRLRGIAADSASEDPPTRPSDPTSAVVAERDASPHGRLATAMQANVLGSEIRAEPTHVFEADGVPASLGRAIVAPRKRVVGGHSYPQFRQEPDETLVKIGYSKSNRKRYEHRAPRKVLERLAAELAELGASDRLFSTDQLFDPPTPSLAEFPTYQVYLCLAFLVHHGLVLKMGRQGYTIAAEAKPDFAAAVRAAFAALPAR